MIFTLGRYGKEAVTTNDHATMNKHIALIGGSGSGKTVQAQNILCQAAMHGETVIALDWHGVLAPDQIFHRYRETFSRYIHDVDAHGKGIPLGLFTPVEFEDGSKESMIDTVGAISDVFTAAFKFGARQESELRKAVTEVFQEGSYAKEGIAVLDSALQKAGNRYAEAVRSKLYYITAHNVFVDGSEFFRPGMINVYRLSRFDLSTQQVIAEVLVNYLWRLGNAGRFKEHPITLFIDECQNMPQGANSGLAHLLSEGRKLGINVIVATQMILQGGTSAVQQRILQAGLQMYFKPVSNRISITASQIDAADKVGWVRVLRNLKVGEFIAAGSFLVDGVEVNEPLKISAREDDDAE